MERGFPPRHTSCTPVRWPAEKYQRTQMTVWLIDKQYAVDVDTFLETRFLSVQPRLSRHSGVCSAHRGREFFQIVCFCKFSKLLFKLYSFGRIDLDFGKLHCKLIIFLELRTSQPSICNKQIAFLPKRWNLKHCIVASLKQNCLQFSKKRPVGAKSATYFCDISHEIFYLLVCTYPRVLAEWGVESE